MKKNSKVILALHLMLMVYSMSGICSKKAAQERLFSVEFCIYYSLVILLLAFYAVCWQQIIKQLPLTTAFANKSITLVWGLIWGLLFFGEQITIGKILGVSMVIIGIILFAKAD